MTLADLTEVWAPLSLVANAIGGLLFGFAVIGWALVNPQYSTKTARPLEVAFVTFAITSCGGLVFYGIQTATTFLDGDAGWTRVVSRFGIWVLFAAAIGVGAWVRLHIDLRIRRDRAHRRALAELNKGGQP
jgi:hypothetical protein